MPAKHSLHVALTGPLVRYVRDKVAGRVHPSASDVVRIALEEMIEREGRDSLQVRPADWSVGHPRS